MSIDPNKRALLFMCPYTPSKLATGETLPRNAAAYFRYTCNQRSVETRATTHRALRERLVRVARFPGDEPTTLKEAEEALSLRRDVCEDSFQLESTMVARFCAHRHVHHAYHEEVRRKQRPKGYIHRQQSESGLMANIKRTFGPTIVWWSSATAALARTYVTTRRRGRRATVSSSSRTASHEHHVGDGYRATQG